MQNLESRTPITNPDDGTPTQYFMRLLQDRGILQGGDHGNLEQLLAKNVVRGLGIDIINGAFADPGDIEISVDTSEALDEISAVRGTVLYRGAAGWAGLAPGTAGDALKTGGAGADPSWGPVASNIQTLLDGISATQGVILFRSNTAWVALAPGTAGHALVTGGAGANPSWATVAANIQTLLDGIGSTRGAVLYRGAGGWVILAPGTAGYALISNGAGADPSFASVAANIQTLLDGIGNTRGSVLYRGVAGWAILTPGSSGTVLSSGGAGADPAWASISVSIQTLLDGISSTQGTILYRSGSAWVALAPGTAGQILKTGGAAANPSWDTSAAPSVSSSVATSQTTSSTAYADLATAGPSVTLTTGTDVLVTISANAARSGGAGFTAYIAPAISGATTLAAADANSAQVSSPGGGFNCQMSRTFKMTGLTPGSNTFKLQYRCDGGGPWAFYDRDITVTPLGGTFAPASGTSFPASPATNDRFFRTDRGLDYYYDGTRWLSVNQFTLHFQTQEALNPHTATGSLRAANPHSGDYAVYVEKIKVAMFNTTAIASNYFTLQAKSIDGGVATNMGAAIAGNSGTINNWESYSATANVVVTSTTDSFTVDFTETGVASVYITGAMTYRLIG